MSLNWNLEGIIDIITGCILLFGALVFIINSKKKNVRPLLYFGVSWLCYSLFFILEAFSYLLLNIEIAKIQTILTVPSAILMVVYIDYTRKESLDVIKMSIVTGFGFIESFLIFTEDSINIQKIDGEYYTIWTGNIFLFSSFMQFLFIALLVYWMILTIKNIPKELLYIKNLLIGGIIMLGPLALLLFVFSSDIRFLVLLSDLSLMIGAIIVIYVLIKEPKIFYILPFTAYNLTVIHINSGLQLFQHKWAEIETKEEALSAGMHALRNMSLNIIGLGDIMDLKVEKGVLISYRTEHIMVGLVSSHSSKFLRRGIKNFAIEFDNIFHDEFSSNLLDESKFLEAEKLIEAHFTYLPSRLE